MFLGNISIRRKLFCAFGAIVLLSASVGILAWLIDSSIQIDISQIHSAAIEKATGSSLMTESLLSLRVSRRDLLMERYRLTDPLAQILAPPDQAKVIRGSAETIEQFQAGLALCREGGRESQELARREGHPDEIEEERSELVMLDLIESKFDAFKDNFEKFTGPQTDLGVLTEMIRHPDDYLELLSLVKSYESRVHRQVDHEVASIGRSLQWTSGILVSFTVLILALSGFLIWFLDRLISRPIASLKASAQRIGRGDLKTDVPIQSEDEFGVLARTFNRMTHDLRATTVSKNYVDSILRSMIDLLIVLHPDHTIKLVNDAALRLLGYAESDLLGQPVEKVLQNPTTRAHPLLQEAEENGFVANIDAACRAKDGHFVPVTISASVLHNAEGAVTGLVCVAQDISERKKAERELEQAQRQLLETSRQAGMAEVATSILHNVGNVLNSVNVSSALISEKVQGSKVNNFGRAAAMMEEHQDDLTQFLSIDPRGRQLPAYLSKLAVNLLHEQQEILAEVETLAGNILHIKEIIAMQQNYARVSGVPEKVEVRDLVENAVRITSRAMERHRIKLVREYADVPSILVERHRVLQILVNLIRNAKHACEDAGRDDKRITLQIFPETGRVKIAVEDNGVGIAEENRSRLFSHGFTTKKEGHGFGLHSSALAAKEMGGALSAASEGPGHGATFTLDLPLEPPTL